MAAIKTPSIYFFTLISLIVGLFMAGPGFGLASAMFTWYVLSYRHQVFARWPKMQTTSLGLLGAIVTGIVILLNLVLVSGLGWLVQGAMGPGKY